jgi:UDP-N-acetyl-alpha-D-muramoyl-L-alanyl-L-glutamate epimerase
MTFDELRRRYPVFRYESFQLESVGSRYIARFRFSVPPDLSFNPEVVFEPVAEGWNSFQRESLENAIFHLGLIESLSYWKATASPMIEVQAGHLTAEQVEWWQDLLMNGMGEYFYHNQIDFTAGDLIRIVPAGAERFQASAAVLPARNLMTIGGGRDSALAAGLLRDSGKPFTCMMLNPSAAARAIAARVTSADPVVISRTIDPGLLDLNRRGFLNGHTPFSAYLGFLGASCLLLYGYSNVIVANERSSDEGNVLYRGKEINHQYSKTLRFETGFDDYLRKYILVNGKYFSLVRPLYELQIAKWFADFPEFFEVFKSCNRNRSASWCGECPKCISVFATMYPFVPSSDLVKIFGRDLFARLETIPILRQLTGFEVKPFECVGTTKEIIAALALALAQCRSKGKALPLVLQYAADYVSGVNDESAAREILSGYGEHRIPAEFEPALSAG